jgi:hypothetical protein
MRSFSVLASLSLLGLAAPASAQVAVELRANGYTEVRVLLSAGAEGGHAVVPMSTLVSTGDLSQQDLVLGRAVDVELEPNSTQTITVPAFCVNSNRSPPSAGAEVQAVRPADPAVTSLLAAQGPYAQHVVQSAVWAYLDGHAPDEQARKIFLLARIPVKTP